MPNDKVTVLCEIVIVDDAISEPDANLDVTFTATYNQGDYEKILTLPVTITRYGYETPELNFTTYIENNTQVFNSQYIKCLFNFNKNKKLVNFV